MSEYKIVAKPGVGEFVDKKSRFIAHVYAIDSEEQAQGYIEELKKNSQEILDAYLEASEPVVKAEEKANEMIVMIKECSNIRNLF